ncbi:glycosyltransferase [Methylobacterium oryzihabitans]|uniref:Glycosyltransferase n=1 Tax=Methylobacterium oryzihabitans TaxID=2499852 RepID=A0A437P661_9HYPH|nr:glycosyltransferase [Methylobacterium oryzihabitans]RVU17755.1 glycosyltransferase [Methylobacterium oryzihabitans]
MPAVRHHDADNVLDWAEGRRPAPSRLRVAVLVPCFNEAATIGEVVRAFRALPVGATVYVYDNNSTDDTAAVAASAGAVVRQETRQGKGHVVRRMFADIEADIYVLVDGDGTYDAEAAPRLIATLLERQLDFVNASRVSTATDAYRRGHRFGNWALTRLVQITFGRQLCDVLSGYKVLSRRFVKSFPAMSQGFETETELAVHALELRMPLAEVATVYRERPACSPSKLRTYRDGARILMLIARLVKDERPLRFFGLLGLGLIGLAVALAFPLVVTFLETGLVPRLPTAVLVTGLGIGGLLSIVAGLILDMTTRSRQEMKRLFYLAVGPLGAAASLPSERA